MKMSLTTNIEKLAKDLDDLAKRQAPFAIALALTRTAMDARSAAVDSLPEAFEIRNNWVERTFRITKAQKGHNPMAIMGSTYEPMALQAEGGTKTGAGASDVAVPIAARADESAVTKPASWPGRLAKKRDFFVAPFGGGLVGKASTGASGVGVFQRIGRRRERKHLRLWWLIEPKVVVAPRWAFEKITQTAVQLALVDNFWAAMEQAVKTARR